MYVFACIYLYSLFMLNFTILKDQVLYTLSVHYNIFSDYIQSSIGLNTYGLVDFDAFKFSQLSVSKTDCSVMHFRSTRHNILASVTISAKLVRNM